MKRQPFILGALGLSSACLIIGLAGWILLDHWALLKQGSEPPIPAGATLDYQLMGEAWKTIEQMYVARDAVGSQRLTYGAIGGMVVALGDAGHSRFLTPEMAQQYHSFIEGELDGVSAYVETREGRTVIVAPFDDPTTQRVGLEPGDIILHADGEDATTLSLDTVAERVQRPAGVRATLTVAESQSESTEKATLARSEIRRSNVTWIRLPGTSVAHIRIAAFSDGVATDLEEALIEVQGRKTSGLILDLRDNPGGLLSEAVGVASQFLQGGDVLLTRGPQGQVTRVAVESRRKALDVPMVVLVNRGTASAAEIVAGALQDAERATVIGETTFGAGTVLGEFTLSDGSMLLLAVEEWRTPKGRVIWHEGLAPTIEVTLPPGVAPLIPLEERDMTPRQVQDSQDAQLWHALDLLVRLGHG